MDLKNNVEYRFSDNFLISRHLSNLQEIVIYMRSSTSFQKKQLYSFLITTFLQKNYTAVLPITIFHFCRDTKKSIYYPAKHVSLHVPLSGLQF